VIARWPAALIVDPRTRSDEEITMKKFVVAAALAFATMLVPVYAAPSSTATQIPVVGTVLTGGAFNGTFNLGRFAVVNGVLTAVGTLTGTVTNSVTGQTTSVLQTLALPVSNVTGTCAILHLDLGPLSLDLLGLQINLSQIVLDITAQAGAGNLLGNLLCAVANRLNNPTGLAQLLNQILALL
jgi:hypothetical protein